MLSDNAILYELIRWGRVIEYKEIKKPTVSNGRLCCRLYLALNKNWRAREESNLNLSLRRAASYPLDHGRSLIAARVIIGDAALKCKGTCCFKFVIFVDGKYCIGLEI